MAEVHQLIIRHGIEEARRQAATKHERHLVEAAYRVLSEDAEKMGFTYSGFALTSLPHKPQSQLVWRREGHNLTLLLESGRDRLGKALGLPHGSYARFILLFLQTEAVRTGSREIELGRSMRVWLGSMGLSIGGTTYKMVTEQARRISGCRLTFYADKDRRELMRHGGFVDGAISMYGNTDYQPALWQERVLLNEEFYRALRKDVEVSWPAVYSQFGPGYSRLRDFRRDFIRALELAVAAYPEARVGLGERGVVLRPSRPAIARG
jgi:hypothetical protein